MDIGELWIAHYVYFNECKDSVLNACILDIGEHLFVHYTCRVFFYWSSLKITKCQPLRKFWHFWWDLLCNLTLSHFLRRTSKKTHCIFQWVQRFCSKHRWTLHCNRYKVAWWSHKYLTCKHQDMINWSTGPCSLWEAHWRKKVQWARCVFNIFSKTILYLILIF